MKKFANILTIVAALLIAAGAALVITALAAQAWVVFKEKMPQ